MKPENKPSRKIGSSALAGALTILMVWVASLFGLDVPGTVGAALTTILMAATGYFVPDA